MMKTRPGLPAQLRGYTYPWDRAWKTLVVGFVLLVLAPGSAHGHGELQGTIPEPGSKLQKAPAHLVINFTEPPTKQSIVTVDDGCREDVVEEVDFQDRTAHVYLRKAQPGRWKVSYEVISSIDGHRTDGSYALTVAGKADCSKDKDEGKGDGGGPGPQAGGDTGGDTEDDESSFPIVPVALGTGGLVALALVVRRLSG